MKYVIRDMRPEDYEGVAEIYGQGMESGTATFQTYVPEYPEWDAAHHPFCRYVAVAEDGLVVGWAALTVGIVREPYKGVAELSVYIRKEYRRHGLGCALIQTIKQNASMHGVWMLESRICRQNIGSIRLHEKCGFRTVGVREKIARDKFGNWQDTVEMEMRVTEAT